MVNELGEARYVRKLRGQSELWNVVEAVLLGLVCAAFCFRMVAFSSDVIEVCTAVQSTLGMIALAGTRNKHGARVG